MVESATAPVIGRRRRPVDLTKPPGVVFSGGPLPLVVEPEAPGVDLAAWALGAREEIAACLARHGAVLFRGFDLRSAADLERFAEAAGTALFGEYGDLPREPQGGKVYGTTPYPADRAILFHNESSHQHRFPRRLFFLCLKAAERGGETPLVDCRRVLGRLEPALVRTFAGKGLRYHRNFTPGIDVSWQEFFRTDDATRVEARCRAESIAYAWLPGGRLRISQQAPAIATHPATGERSFFNQIQLHHPSRLSPEVRESLLSLMSEDDLPRNVTFGDGTPIADDVVEEIAAITEELAVDRLWREGEVVMVENILVAHGRRPFAGSRKVVVAMGDMVETAEVARPDGTGRCPEA
jgi:alpha-ketoglutarate-dependent taurine dioxygenase